MPSTIRTIKFGTIPTAFSDRYLNDDVIDTVEMDNGDLYEVKKSFTGSIVALFVR